MTVINIKAIWPNTPKEFFKRIFYKGEIYYENSDPSQIPLLSILFIIVADTSHILNKEHENISPKEPSAF